MKKNAFLFGLLIIASLWVSCKQQAPEAYFDIQSESMFYFQNPIVGEEVSFMNRSVDADSYLWDFGDGETSTELNPKHIYNQGGKYKVALEATNKKEISNYSTYMVIHSLSGDWEGSFMLDNENYDFIFKMEQNFEELKGTFEFSDESGISTLTSSTIKKYDVTINFNLTEGGTSVPFKFTGKVNSDYDKIKGLFYSGGYELGEWSAEKTSSKSVKIENNSGNSEKATLFNALKGKLR